MRDRLAVVVPMKPLAMAKQRLRPAVGDAARQRLAGAMLVHVLHIVQDSGVADVAGIVSDDPGVLALAAQYGFAAIADNPIAGYNAAVQRASTWAQAHDAHALLILPSDLPLLTTADIQTIVGLIDTPKGIVIAPDASKTGTNALLLRPPHLIKPQFGPHSFQRHCQQAARLGCPPIIYHSPTLAHDIDSPSDLAFLRSRNPSHA